MRSPYNLITSSRLAGGNSGSLPASSLGAGRLVTRYQVDRSGRLSGSVVATMARSVLSGPYGPATISKTHQSCVLPSRKVLVTYTHLPGCSALSQPASCATSCNVPATSPGCHQPCEGLSASTYGCLRSRKPLLNPRSSPYNESATTARNGIRS